MRSPSEDVNPARRFLEECAIRFLRTPSAVFIAIVALALGTRLIGISTRPIWYDEAFSILFAEKGPSAMVLGALTPTGLAAPDVHPLGYYVILWQWIRVFGASLVSVRALSVLASTAAIVPVYLLARGLFGTATALTASVVFAIAPFQVHYGQEIRMYAFLCLFLMLATYSYWRGSRSPGFGWWIGLAVFAALAEFTQYLAVFYLAPLAAWPLLTRDWRSLRRVLLAAGLAVVLSLPWLIKLPEQFAKVSEIYWIGRPPPSRLLTLLLTFVTNLPLPGWLLPAGLFITLTLVTLMLVQAVRSIRAPSDDSPAGILWIAYLTIAPPVFLFAFSQWKPLYVERALLPSGAIFCIWLGWTILRTGLSTPVRAFTILLMLSGFAMGLYEHVNDAGFPYARFSELARNLESRRQADDIIVHSSKLSLLPTMYFDRSLPETYIADPSGSPVDTLSPETRQILGIQSEPNIQAATSRAGRVWYIIFDESNREYVQAGYPRHPDLTWLMQRYRLVELSHWGQLSLYLFGRMQ